MEKKDLLKRDTGMYAAGLLLYSVLMYICYDGYVVVRYYFTQAVTHGEKSAEAMSYIKTLAAESGVPYLISVSLGVVLLFKFYQDMGWDNLFGVHKKMKASTFFQLFLVFMGMQFLFDIWADSLEAVLNVFGLSVTKEIAAASDASTTVSMFLYTSLFAPITEELIFRGFLLKGLKKYGKGIAIVTSAVLFGVFHANLVQSVFAFAIGLVLGYVAMEYSICWAIALHFINNCVFSELVGILTNTMTEVTKAYVIEGMDLFFFVAALLVLLYHRQTIRLYLWENRTFSYREPFTHSWIVVYFGLNLLAACAGIVSL